MISYDSGYLTSKLKKRIQKENNWALLMEIKNKK